MTEVCIDYVVGTGGSATVMTNGQTRDFRLNEIDEVQTAQVDLEIKDEHGSSIMKNIYNRNSLPDTSDVSEKEYKKAVNDLNKAIVVSIDATLRDIVEI